MKLLNGATTDYGRRIPPSHPVLKRMQSNPRATLPPVTAVEVSFLNARINDLALRVVDLPDVPLDGANRRGLVIIARELLRRAGGPTERS